jgi:hypothetical protein
MDFYGKHIPADYALGKKWVVPAESPLSKVQIADRVFSILLGYREISYVLRARAPNTGVTASATTDVNGEAIFTWSSSTAGIDEVTATIATAPGQFISTTATKTWIDEINNVIPEVPFGTIAIAIAMMFGFAVYYKKGKMHKTKPL